MKQHDKYAAIILGLVNEVFDEDPDHFIGVEELEKGDNLSHFFHAFATVAPNAAFNKITGMDKDNLEFNHVANQLCFQFCNIEETKE
jgi:hypothetical protein